MRNLKPFREVNLLRARGLSGPFMAPYGKNKQIHTVGGSGGGGAPIGGVRLAFDALTYNSSFEMVGVKQGIGGLVAVHTSPILAKDKDGVYQRFPANAPVWEGARCVLAGGPGTDVVTAYADDGTGTLLPDHPYLFHTPAATNSQIQSNDLTNAEWTAAGVTVAKNETGIDGVANSACTLTATGANGTVLANIITAASVLGDQATAWHIKRKTGTGQVEITVDGGISWVPVPLTTGFERFVTFKNMTNPQIGIRITTSGDEVIVGNAECHTDKADYEVEYLPPIFTVAASVSIDETVYSFDLANHDDAIALYYCEYMIGTSNQKGTTQSGILTVLSGLPTSLLYLQDSASIGVASIAKGYDGTNVPDLKGDWAAWMQYKTSSLYSTEDNKFNVCRNGVYATEQGYDGSFNPVGAIGVFHNNAAIRYPGKMRRLQRYDGPDYAAIESKNDELMA